MLWIRRIQLLMAISFLMVYVGIQALTGLHVHPPTVCLTKVEITHKQEVLHGGKQCLVCDFLFKKLPENSAGLVLFLSSSFLTLVSTWTVWLLSRSLSPTIFQQPGRAPPVLLSCIL